MFVYQMVCHILYPKFQSTVCHILSQLICLFLDRVLLLKGWQPSSPHPLKKRRKKEGKSILTWPIVDLEKEKKKSSYWSLFLCSLFNMMTNLSLLELLQNQNRVSLIIFQVKKKNIYYYILTNQIKPQEISLSKNWR